MESHSYAYQAVAALRQILGPQWEFATSSGGNRDFQIQHRDHGTPYRPPRSTLSWSTLLDGLSTAFAARGVMRDECLPLRWGRETELTISAVQALDPLLKDGRAATYRQGFLPQPVVRFTGDRDEHGNLRDGFLTSFVNVSRVQPIASFTEYAEALDDWLSVLSQLGFHARHMQIDGRIEVWRRRQVAGVTLRFNHLDLTIGDLVLLWNIENPDRMALDLGTGLERLAWARTRQDWKELIFASFADAAPVAVLDAIRTATLLLGSGIMPSARGAGSVSRRVIATIPHTLVRLGTSTILRAFHRYWAATVRLPVPWPEVCNAIEQEVATRLDQSVPQRRVPRDLVVSIRKEADSQWR
ncbi:hypothetical protein H9Y04_18050 [Streptomyces sp. TRM66268-LWL]|uniref:Uncharacterized protein n=1 Tax=Streptomyces polyasparticus TaxID=2767826 RepID=A0ABR7SG46_9ACTN|nr:hypothetical protein [Streptomyces polyasparticus]MBC9714466.1 hypothetical protein [Streptomyces polyasparticus]